LRACITAGSVSTAAHDLGISETTVRQHLSGRGRRPRQAPERRQEPTAGALTSVAVERSVAGDPQQPRQGRAGQTRAAERHEGPLERQRREVQRLIIVMTIGAQEVHDGLAVLEVEVLEDHVGRMGR
jgi:hypothetical protein